MRLGPALHEPLAIETHGAHHSDTNWREASIRRFAKLSMSALALVAASSASANESAEAEVAPTCAREIVVLGAGQDAGAPQIGNANDIGPEIWPVSIAIVDHEAGTRYLIDASPAITDQLAMLDQIAPPKKGRTLGIDGVFLTHAHIGHYLGLAYFGFEAANTKNLTVHAMPRMKKFLETNAPWNLLIEFENITLSPLAAETFAVVSDELGLLPILVPHRDELSETVGFIIMTPDKRALYVPDVDDWDEYAEASGSTLQELLAGVDIAIIDGTFWDDNELPGRDMSKIPHPRITKTMERLKDLPASERAKVYFTHYNHTNPVRDWESPESQAVAKKGFNVARRGMRLCLSEDDAD